MGGGGWRRDRNKVREGGMFGSCLINSVDVISGREGEISPSTNERRGQCTVEYYMCTDQTLLSSLRLRCSSVKVCADNYVWIFV